MINKISLKTNVHSDEIMDGLKSTFQTDRRIWAMGWKKDDDGNIVITVEAEMDNEEIIAKFNSVGFKAVVCS